MLQLHPATEADIDWIMALQRRPANAPFVFLDDGDTHRGYMTDVDTALLVAEEAGAPLGFAILRGLTSSARAVELLRIIVAEPGQGVGGRFLAALIGHVFSELEANRFWLDVFDDNDLARAAYRRVGFVQEGVLREAARRTNGALGSLVVMSILRRDWDG